MFNLREAVRRSLAIKKWKVGVQPDRGDFPAHLPDQPDQEARRGAAAHPDPDRDYLALGHRLRHRRLGHGTGRNSGRLGHFRGRPFAQPRA